MNGRLNFYFLWSQMYVLCARMYLYFNVEALILFKFRSRQLGLWQEFENKFARPLYFEKIKIKCSTYC